MPALLDAVEPTDRPLKVEYEAAKLSIGRLRNGAGDWVVLTNKDLLHPYDGTARVALSDGRRLYDLLALREVTVRGDGAFDLDLPAGGGVILMVATASSWSTVRHGIVERRVEQEQERLSVECGVLKVQGLDVRKIEEALKHVGPIGAGLESVREMLAQAQTGNAACSMMGGRSSRWWMARRTRNGSMRWRRSRR
jgi:hypothetical protein